MFPRIAAFIYVLVITTHCNFASSDKSKKCDNCKSFVRTGRSPYQILWHLRENLSGELPTDVVVKKMLLNKDDIKLAEGFFLEYCNTACRNPQDNCGGLPKNVKMYNFQSLEEQERFREEARKELNKGKKNFRHLGKTYSFIKLLRRQLENDGKTSKPENQESGSSYQDILIGPVMANLLHKSIKRDSGSLESYTPEFVKTPDEDEFDSISLRALDTSPEEGKNSTAGGDGGDAQNKTESSVPSSTEKSSSAVNTTEAVTDKTVDVPKTKRNGTQTESKKKEGEKDENKAKKPQKIPNDSKRKLKYHLVPSHEKQKISEEFDNHFKNILQMMIHVLENHDLVTSEVDDCLMNTIMAEVEAFLGLPIGFMDREPCTDKNYRVNPRVSALIHSTLRNGIPEEGKGLGLKEDNGPKFTDDPRGNPSGLGSILDLIADYLDMSSDFGSDWVFRRLKPKYSTDDYDNDQEPGDNKEDVSEEDDAII